MRALFAAEMFKIWKRQMIPVMAVVSAGVIAIIYVALAIALSSEGGEGGLTDLERAVAIENVVPFGYRIVVSQVVTIMAIILAASVVGGEYSWRTVVTLTAWTGDRRRLMAARVAALGVTSLVGIVAGFAFTAVCAVLLSWSRGELDTGSLSVGMASAAVAGAGPTWLGMMAYLALTVAITVLTRSTAAGIGMVLAIRFIEPLGTQVLDALGGPMEGMKQLALSQNVGAVQAGSGFIEGLDDNQELPPAWRATFVVVAFSAMMVLASLRMAIRRDIRE